MKWWILFIYENLVYVSYLIGHIDCITIGHTMRIGVYYALRAGTRRLTHQQTDVSGSAGATRCARGAVQRAHRLWRTVCLSPRSVVSAAVDLGELTPPPLARQRVPAVPHLLHAAARAVAGAAAVVQQHAPRRHVQQRCWVMSASRLSAA